MLNTRFPIFTWFLTLPRLRRFKVYSRILKPTGRRLLILLLKYWRSVLLVNMYTRRHWLLLFPVCFIIQITKFFNARIVFLFDLFFFLFFFLLLDPCIICWRVVLDFFLFLIIEIIWYLLRWLLCHYLINLWFLFLLLQGLICRFARFL